MKKVLIISYNFPPKSGISSRRWVKLAKQLNRKGVECHVITRNGGKEKGINWSKDMVELDSTKIHRLKNLYPRFLEKQPTSFFIRIIKYLGIKLLKSFFFKVDSAQFFYHKLIPKAKKIIRSGVNNVIVTGPPHSILFHASVLKNEHPHINLILDYRDAWNDEITYEYKTSLRSFSSKMNSIQMEYLALVQADKVLFVTDDMRKRTANLYKNLAHKFEVFHNFYDHEDYDKSNLNIDENLTKKIVYLGTLGSGRRKALELLAQAIYQLELRGESISTRFHFYTNETLTLFRTSSYKKTMQKYFVFHPIVETTEVSKILSNFSYCLSINDPNYSHAFGTKIFDYMAMKKHIFHISNGGELFEILEKKNHMVATYDIEMIQLVLKRIESLQTTNFDINFDRFDLKVQTSKLINMLQ